MLEGFGSLKLNKKHAGNYEEVQDLIQTSYILHIDGCSRFGFGGRRERDSSSVFYVLVLEINVANTASTMTHDEASNYTQPTHPITIHHLISHPFRSQLPCSDHPPIHSIYFRFILKEIESEEKVSPISTMRSTSCCLRLYPSPTSKASLIPTNPPQLSLEKNRGSWKRPCVVIGVASCFTIIGLQFNNSLISQHEVLVPKEEIMVVTMSNSMEDDEDEEYDEHEHVVLVGGVAKWSQKRMCPSWQGNNPLETIVPENLPRPAARRRYEAVRSDSKTAPPLSLSSVKDKTSRDDCFSM